MRVLIVALLVLLPTLLHAEEPVVPGPASGTELTILPRQAVAPLTETPPHLDGVANEAEWAAAAPLNAFSPFAPDDTGEAGFHVTGRLLRTHDALWVAVQVEVPQSDLNRGLGPRDGWPSGDYVEVQIDPFATGLRAYSFVLSASGQLRDATVNDVSNTDASWDSLFDGAVGVEADRWTAEFKIPFASLPHPSDGASWRLNVFATSWKRQQTVVWSRIERNLPNRLSQAGWIGGMEGLHRGGGLSFFPAITLDAAGEDGGFALGSAEVGRTGLVADGGAVRPSLSGLWQPAPQSRVEAAWNPDYSQVEADAGQLQVNNRFALYLDEKRPFFLEGQDLFALPTELIYTRSIGRPLYALKGLTEWSSGRAGVIAAYDVESARRGADGESIVIAERSQFNAGERNLVGQTITYRSAEPTADDSERSTNLVAGLDGSFYPLPTLRVKTDLAASHTDQGNIAPNGTSANATVSWEQKRFRLATQWQRIDEDFRADTGFVNRVGFETLRAKLDGYYRSSEGRVSYLSPGIWQQQWWDMEREAVESVTGINTYLQTAGRNWVFATFTYNREREEQTGVWLETPVSELAAGAEPTDWLSVEGGARVGAAVLRDASLVGTDADGTPNPARVGFEQSPYVDAIVRPFPSMAITLDWQARELFDEAGGTSLSRQDLLRAKVQHWFHRSADFRYICEWDSLAEAVNQDLLFSYQPMPGTVFYSGLHFDGATSEEPSRWSLFLKASLRLEAL